MSSLRLGKSWSDFLKAAGYVTTCEFITMEWFSFLSRMDLVQGKGVIDQKNLDISIFKLPPSLPSKRLKCPHRGNWSKVTFRKSQGSFPYRCSTGTSQQHLHLTIPCLKMCFRTTYKLFPASETPDSKKATLKDSKAHINSFWSLLHGRKEARKTIFTQQLLSKRIITIVR